LYGVTLPQGFEINKDLKFICFSLVIFRNISILIYLQVRSITSGIKALSWAKQRDFYFYFCRDILGWQDFRSDLKLLVQNLQKQIAYQILYENT